MLTLYATGRGRVCAVGTGLAWSAAVEGCPTHYSFDLQRCRGGAGLRAGGSLD